MGSVHAGLQHSRFFWHSNAPEKRQEQTLSWTNPVEAKKVIELAAHLVRYANSL